MSRFSDEGSPVEVFSGSAWEAGLVKSLLENAEIGTFMKDEIRGTYAPWHVSPGGVGSVKLLVSARDLPRALEVIGMYERNKLSDQ